MPNIIILIQSVVSRKILNPHEIALKVRRGKYSLSLNKHNMDELAKYAKLNKIKLIYLVDEAILTYIETLKQNSNI